MLSIFIGIFVLSFVNENNLDINNDILNQSIPLNLFKL